MEMSMKLVLKEIEAKRNFVNVADKLCEVVQKFDGKVLNKRLETALREVYPIRVEIEKDWDWVNITGYVPDRMVQSDDVDRHGYHQTAYIKDDRIYICSCMRDAMDDDGRVIAENIIKRIRDTALYEEESADELERQIAMIDEIKAKCKELRAERDRFNRNVCSQIRMYFNLEV